ncbi:MAG TPA: riboflavin synthase [Gemmatimonadales bacterium]|jgi:riboflavin synthase
MFTGIITAIGTITRALQTKRGLRLTIAAPYRGLEIGESVAIDGACLTVVARGKGSFSVEAIGTTRSRTRVGEYEPGTRVNLERAMRATDRLGGHLVAGHVDGVGTIRKRQEARGRSGGEAGDESVILDIAVPPGVFDLCVPHGSIAVDGVSLTINDLPKRGIVQVALIPHTLEMTTLSGAGVGQRVHLEADLIGKFVRQLARPYRASGRRER